MIVGGYTLDLYCEGQVGPCQCRTYRDGGMMDMCFGQFTGETASECRRKARRAKWRFDKTETGYKPVCNSCRSHGRTCE